MPLFPFKFFGKKQASTSETFIPLNFMGGFATGTRIDCKTKDGQLNAYVNCPPVPTIIIRKATAANNARWWFGKEDGTKTSNGELKRLENLFNKPNKDQSFNRFFMTAYTMQQLYGVCYIHVIKPAGFRSTYASEMRIYPTRNVTIYYKPMSDDIDHYQVNYKGKIFEVQPDDMLVWNDFTLDMTLNGSALMGQSRLFSLSDPVNTIIAAYEANNTLLTNFGMAGIISPDTGNKVQDAFVPMDDEDKTRVQNDLQRKYGVQRNQWPLMVTTQPIKYTAVTRATKDLMLMETIEDATRQLCDAYNYPITLLGFSAAKTMDNLKVDDKRVYESAIIPEVQSFADAFNAYFGVDSDNKLRFSFDHLPVLQASRLENEQALQIAVNRLAAEITNNLTDLQAAKDELQNLKD